MSTNLEIQALASSLRDLQHLLSTSLGPLGADKVVETDAKAFLVTNNGIDLLNVISSQTAMLSLVVQSIKAFVSSHGDGSKRLVLLVSQGLSEVIRQAQGCMMSMISMVRGLSVLQAKFVDEMLEDTASGMQLRLCINAAGDAPRAYQEVICALLTTHLTNKVGSRAVQHLALLVTDMVLQRVLHGQKGSTQWEILRHVHSQPLLCLLPGGMVTSSRLIPGVILRQALSSPHMYPMLERCDTIQFVVLSCCLDALDGATGIANSSSGNSRPFDPAVQVSSGSQLRAAAHSHQRMLRCKLELLAQQGVNLVLSTHPASPLLTFLCLEAGLAMLGGLEEEDAETICSAAQISTIASLGDSTLQSACVGKADGCYKLALGKATAALVLKLSGKGFSTMLLCAPSEGLCRQYAKLVKSGLAVLAAAAVPGHPTTPAEDHGNTNKATDDNHCQEVLLLIPGGSTFDSALAVHLEHALRFAKGARGSDGFCADSHQALSALLKQHPPTLLLPALKVLHAMAMAVPNALARTGMAGRASEAGSTGMHDDRLVRHRALSQVHSLLASHRDMMAGVQQHMGLVNGGSASRLTADALRILGISETSAEHRLTADGPSENLVVASPAAHGVIEARAVNVSLWSHAITLLIQILRIDHIAAASPSQPGGMLRFPRPGDNTAAKKSCHVQSSDDSDAESSSEDERA